MPVLVALGTTVMTSPLPTWVERRDPPAEAAPVPADPARATL
ncbi:hypothetical protein [Cellulomonas dongxiuzhuiae]|nr:hypothetical protein [Cellulomonas dongxiuzhuiae]